MKRRIVALGTVVALGFGLSACGGGGAGSDVIILRVALNQTETHPSYVALSNYSDRLEEQTDGRMRLDIFPNETLGAQAEVLQLLSDNIIDLGIISGSQMENLSGDFLVLNMPGVFDSVEHQMPVVHDPEIVGELYTSLEDSNDITVMGGFTQGSRHIYTKNKVTSLADLDGVKIRVQESELNLAMIRALGGSPTPMAFGEVYTALQSGVLDGAENNEVSYFTQKHFEVAPFFTNSNHLVGLDYMVASTEMLEGLAPEDRQLLEDEWINTYEDHIQLWDEATQEAIEGAQAGGAEWVEIDQEEVRAALEPLADEFLTTPTQRQLYDKIRAAAPGQED
ncbi:TRAP transporter substrate-binding protein [Ornithinimicrobium faecis]|uniref:TRAP transporter substrate-binding protein n=1 Tax=Ornithinimicrobium faecis TaxID=2934158 RepID=A0ABY4YWG5_9MICO|nr:TRAP transporter substrate-binding protein [Ornithinimicrobium sp. HY1793]USQ80585.1 TRAP transporter substrate-binding protein [Ornithinimicrobium sp. HY1793]